MPKRDGGLQTAKVAGAVGGAPPGKGRPGRETEFGKKRLANAEKGPSPKRTGKGRWKGTKREGGPPRKIGGGHVKRQTSGFGT